jgi:D-amino-acid dehydrogenase
MSATKGLHVVVIGAGIVGAATALELLRDGHRVTIVEPGDPGGEQAASYGSGGWLSPAAMGLISMPGLLSRLTTSAALDPLTVRSTYAARVMPWLARFIYAAASDHRVERVSRALYALLEDCPERHLTLAEEAGVGYLIRHTGLLYAYPSQADFTAQSRAWRLRRERGVGWTELDADALREREPALGENYSFGVFVQHGAHCVDPGGYVAALAARARTLGATLVRARATGFVLARGKLRAVSTSEQSIACDRAVIAAGVWSKALAREAGDDVPLESARGYSALISEPGFELRHAVRLSPSRVASVMTLQGLRLAGQAELAGLKAAPNWRRADVLRYEALKAYPALPRRLPPERVKEWMGHRPMLPDSLPCIGLAGFTADVVHCFGHGHVGLAAGPMSGRLVADVVSGKQPVIDPAPYSPSRFR